MPHIVSVSPIFVYILFNVHNIMLPIVRDPLTIKHGESSLHPFRVGT